MEVKVIMMPYLSCKKIENDVYNFPTWQYCKYKDIFDSRIIINSTAKFYISISYQKDLLSIDTRIFTPSFRALHSHNPFYAPLRSVLNMCHWHIAPHYSHIVGLSSHFYAHIGAGPKVFHPPMSKLMWI